MSDPNKMVKLKNGSEHPDSSVRALMVSLKSMLQGGASGGIAFWELHQKCQNDSYNITGSARRHLVDLGLMTEDGRIHDTVRDVVLSAATGSGLGLNLTSPYA